MPGSYKNNKILRVICLGLVFCICLSVVMAPKAHAISELVIVGALALTISACAAVVIIAAEPLGLKDTIVSAAQHGFQTPREFVATLLARYGASQGLQQFVLMDKFQKGVLVATTGKVLIDSTLSKWLQDFFDWSWSADGGGLINYATITGEQFYDPQSIQNPRFDLTGYGNIYAANYVTGASNSWRNIQLESETCKFVFVSGILYVFSDTSNQAWKETHWDNAANKYVQNGKTGTTTYSGYTYHMSGGYNAGYKNLSISQSSVTAPSGALRDATLAYILSVGTLEGGTIEEPTIDDLSLPAPDAYNNFDVPGALTLPAPISGTTTATNYLEAAADAITAGTGSLEYEDANGQTQTGTLEGTGEIGLTQVGSQSAELEGAIDIADGVGSPTLDNYAIDLKDFFPFCLPFDLYDMLNLLSAEPEAPVVEVPLDFGDLGTHTIEIDLSPFDTVAQVLRTMELMLFCVGLALGTKKLLYGS